MSLSSFLGERTQLGKFPVRHVAVTLLCLAACLSCARAPKEASTQTPRATPESLALSHLKEADVALSHHTKASAERAVEMATASLGWAPPRSRIEHWLVGRMLLTRGRALIELKKQEQALADLDAALAWARRDPDAPELLFAEIHLAQAQALLGLAKTDEAYVHVNKARLSASHLGSSGLALLCDVLILEGDIVLRLGRDDTPLPDSYYRQVFTSAARYDYPEDTWPHLDRALARLGVDDGEQRAVLMGPVDARRAKSELEQSQKHDSERRIDYGAPRAPDTGGFAGVAFGSIPGAAQTISELHQSGFRRCYQRALQDNPNAAGSIRLELSVASDGRVDAVQETHMGLDPAVVDCVVEVARGARFAQPESTSAVVVVPINFVKQP